MDQCIDKMEKLVDLAQDLLDKSTEKENKSARLLSDATKTLNTLKWASGAFLVAWIGWMIHIEVSLAERPTTGTTVSKKEAVTVHTINLDHIQNVANIITDDYIKQDRVRQENLKTLDKIKQVYSD